MSTDTALDLAPPGGLDPSRLPAGSEAPVPTAGAHPGLVVARLTSGKALRSGLLWGVVFGIYVALQAKAYVSTYPTKISRELLAQSFSSGGLNAMMGPAHDLATVSGYTAWKSLGALSVLGAIWALLLSTKLLRGEEDAGRWELLLAGHTTHRRACVQAMAGLGLAVAALFACTAVITIAVGREAKVGIASGPALFFTLSLVSGAVMFMAGGVLAGQLAPNRRQAAAYAGTALGAFFAVRMFADASAGLTWLNWLTPLGWVDRLQTLTSPQPVMLLPIASLTGVMVVAAIWLAGGRDLNASILPDRSSSEAHTALLGGPVGLATRLVRPTVLGWLAGVAAAGLLFGGIAKQAAKSLEASPSARSMLERLGGSGGAIKAYLGVCFLMLALLISFVAASQCTALRREEASGRVEHLLVRPVSRARWLWGRLAVAALVLLVAGVLGGVTTWLGALSQHAGMGFSAMMGAGLNVIPPAVVLVGAGVLALGLSPRFAISAVYAVLAWSFLVELLNGIVTSNHWFLDTSIFHQMATAPAVSPDWVSATAMVGVGVAAALAGTAALARRDLAGE